MSKCTGCGRNFDSNNGCHYCAMKWSRPPATPPLLSPHSFAARPDDATGNLFNDEQLSRMVTPSPPYKRKSDR